MNGLQTLKVEYDTFSDEWYKKVEEIVLVNYKFNEEQKKFIHYSESTVIEAGPGSGKTTALAAKVALLLNKIEVEGSLTGVCVITHTNAAVDEILKVLKKLGYKDIPHPHFIGTIHSFYNKYLLPKVFYTEISKLPINYVESIPSWEYQKFIQEKHPWLNKGPMQNVLRRLNAVKYNIELFPFKIETENIQKWDKFGDYEIAFNYAIRERLKKGILFHDDTLRIVNQLLQKKTYIHKILKRRFQYVLIDEYQDTEKESLSNFINVFNSENNVIQLIGDKNQHIYYGREVLNKIDMPIHYMNITNRFGNKIVTPLNRVFEGEIVAQDENKSVSPVLYIYNDSVKLVTGFTEILDRNKINTEKGNPCILVAKHTHAEHMKQETNKYTQNNSKTDFQLIQNEVYKLLASKINVHVQSIKSMLCIEYKDFHIEINKNVINYLRGDSISKIKDSINSLLVALQISNKINLNNNFFKKITSVKNRQNNMITNNINLIRTSTIHNIKGQTLLANMVYLNKGSKEEHGFLESYNSHLPKPKGYLEIDKRVIYVAMSRSTTFLSVALHADTYDKLTEETKIKLKEDFIVQKDSDILK